MNLLENLYGVLFRPTATFKYFDMNFNYGVLWQSIIGFILALALSNQFSAGSSVNAFVMWFIGVNFVFWNAYVFKLQRKDYLKFLALLAFANIPLIFRGISGIFTEISDSLGMLFDVSISVWIFNLSVIAVSIICDIRKSRIVLLFLLPFIHLSVLLAVFLLTLFGEVFNLLMN